MSNQPNLNHEQFTDGRLLELFKGQTEQNTELLRHNRELLVKLEEKNNTIQQKDSDIKEKELLLIKERSKYENLERSIYEIFVFACLCFIVFIKFSSNYDIFRIFLVFILFLFFLIIYLFFKGYLKIPATIYEKINEQINLNK